MNQPTRQQAADQHKRKTGLIAARIGTSHRVKCGDGMTRSLSVKDATQRPTGKDVEALTVGCLTCGKMGIDLSDLQSQHPPAAEMKKDREAHVYALVSLKGFKDAPAAEVDLDLDPLAARAAFNAQVTRNRNAQAAYDRSSIGLFAEPVLE